MDYFAVSLPDLQIWDSDLSVMNRTHCVYMLALGYTGLGNSEMAEKYIAELKALAPGHQGVQALESLTTYMNR